VAVAGHIRLLSRGLNINDPHEDRRHQAVLALKEGIDEAYEMGAQSFAFLSGNYKEERKEDAYNALVASVRELCSYAQEKGELLIELEIFDYDIDKKSLIGPAMLAQRFAREIRATHNNFGLMVDLSHLPLLRESPTEALLPIKEYITHAHLGNCVVKSRDLPGYGDHHPRFGFPNGENDVAETMAFIRVLLDINFLNPKCPPIISFEVKPFENEDPDLVIANAKRVLNEAWARL
jgi:sugar phosphate isomerase/epimerase